MVVKLWALHLTNFSTQLSGESLGDIPLHAAPCVKGNICHGQSRQSQLIQWPQVAKKIKPGLIVPNTISPSLVDGRDSLTLAKDQAVSQELADY